MKELKELMRVLIAIFRYPAAVVVAFWASIATMLYLPDLFQQWNPNDDSTFWGFIWFFSTGQAGVGTGSLCLPRKQQWLGSLFLLVLGLSFTFLICCMASDDGTIDLPLLLSVGAGGFVPVAIHYLLRPTSDSKQNGKELSVSISSGGSPN